MNTKQEITISLSKCGSNQYSITQTLSPFDNETTKKTEEKMEPYVINESGDSSTRAIGNLSAQKMRLPRKVKTRESKVLKLLDENKFFRGDAL